MLADQDPDLSHVHTPRTGQVYLVDLHEIKQLFDLN